MPERITSKESQLAERCIKSCLFQMQVILNDYQSEDRKKLIWTFAVGFANGVLAERWNSLHIIGFADLVLQKAIEKGLV